MQYQFNERFEYVKTIEFINSNPLVNVEKIRYFKEEGVTGSFTSKEFRYSFDNAVWTNWNTLTQSNLAAINFKDRPNFYLNVRYTRTGIAAGNIERFYVFYDSTTPTPPAPPTDSSLDAWTLRGEGPEYYLDRANHTGPYVGLNMENVSDPSAIGTYFERVDTSFGTTFRFKSIKGENGITVDEQSGIITIDGSTLSTQVSERLDALDASVIRIDASMNVIYPLTFAQDVSIGLLTQWNIAQDASIEAIRADVSLLDPAYVDDRLNALDASVEDLRADVSILQYEVTVIEGEITIIDSSLTQIHADVSTLWDKSEASDASIVDLRVDLGGLEASIVRIDASIDDILVDISTLEGDVSILYGDISRLDSEQSIQDASIQGLRQYDAIQDASIVDITIDISSLYDDVSVLDSSVQYLTDWNIVQDVSIVDLQDDVSVLDASVVRIDLHQAVQDASIEDLQDDVSVLDASVVRIDSDISTLFYKTEIIDSSIERIDDAIAIIEASIGLIEDDEVINIGDGSIAIYAERDSSRNILLRTIDQTGPVYLTQDNSTILVDSSLVKLYDTSLGTDTSLGELTFMPYPVGGLEAETSVGSLDRETYTRILDELLFPTTDPCIIEPSITFDISTYYLHEVDENISVFFTTTFDKGEINVGDVFQDYRAGDPSAYYFMGPGFTDIKPDTSTSYTYVVNLDLSVGIESWYSWVDYTDGPQPYNNKGSDFGSALSDGSTAMSVYQLESTYPFYSNANDINIMVKGSPLASTISGNLIELDLAAEVGGKQIFDIATYWINPLENNRPLQGIQTFNSLGDDWEYQGGNPTTAFGYWDVSTTIHTVQGQLVNYTRYIYNGVDRSNAKIRLVF